MANINADQSAPKNLAMDVWAGAVPKDVVSERKVSVIVNQKYWNALYNLCKIASASEEVKRRARAAVYLYCAINGTSRAGEYTTDIITADGTIFNASFIAKACNIRDVRKWLRANADEAIDFFRVTGVLQNVYVLVQRALALGYGADAVIGVVDFVTDSPKLTVTEARLNEASFNTSIQRARGAREGKSLEDVENNGVTRGIEAQSSVGEAGSVLRM